MKIHFKACEHLDYGPDYGQCRRQLININGTSLCWRRTIIGDLVQFCKLRGRINSPTACLSKDAAICNDFNETMKNVDVPQEELDN